MEIHDEDLINLNAPMVNLHWNKINDLIPNGYDVIIGRDEFDDKAYEYFIGAYCEREEEWELFMIFPCEEEKSSSIRITIPIKSTDIWAYFN